MRDYGTTNNTPAHQAPPVWRAPEGLEDLTAAQVGDGGACQHTNDKPDRSGAPRGLRGLAAVLVGGGRAWSGFEIDHSERSSRVAISRAGRRPPAHTAARPNKTSHAAAGPGRASRRRAERSSRRGRRAGGPLPTGTHSGPAQQNWPRGGRAWPGFEKTRRANHQHTRLHWCGGHRRELPRCRWAVVAPHRRCGEHRGPAHRHQHAGTNTQPQIHRHNEAARPHRGRAAHASGRYAAISEVFSASGCRWRPGARRPRRRGRPCRPRPTCPTYAGRTAS